MHGYFSILPLLSAVLCAGLGLFTFSRNPRHPANIGFTLGMFCLAVNEAGSVMALLSAGEGALLGMRTSLIGQALLPVAWLFFSIVFARSNYKEILSRWVPVLIGAGIISGFFMLRAGNPGFIALSSIAGSIFEEEATSFIIGPFGRYFYIYLILGLVLCLVQLENTLRSSTGSKRWHIKYVIFGVGSILAFFIYLSSQALLFSTLDIQNIPLASSVILISVSILALFIIKHRLLDVDIFISRYVIYNSLTVFLVGLYLLSVGIIAHGIKYFNIPFNYFFTTLFVFVSILALFILFFTSTLRRKAQLFINRHFYKHKYEFRDKWMETIEKISSKRSVEETHKTLAEMVSDTMGAKDVYLWLYDPISREYCAARDDLDAVFKKIKCSHPLVEQTKICMGPFMINDIEGKTADTSQRKEFAPLLAATGAVLCAPLIADQDIVGFILQGEDLSGEPYRQDDFEFLKAVTTQAAVQIKNIRLTQELLNVKEVEAFHRLSAFVMHDLKNLTNSLSLVSQNARHNINKPEFQQDALKTIDSTVTRMKGLIERLSNLPREVEIKKERVELKSLIHNAIRKIPLTSADNVTVTNEIDYVPPVNVDPDAMEMVFLNIFTNAYQASIKDGRITVRASLSNNNVDITISDNGVGISKEFIERDLFKPFKTTKKNGLGIGLFQCKTIIEAHGGTIEVQSELKKGTTFKVSLPVFKEILPG